jgi:transcriptional regulator with XRE-family HTH domain
MFYDDKKFIGNVLKQARINVSLSQIQLAEAIGLSEKHISNIERGQNFPSLDTFFRLCKVLNLTLTDFGINITSTQNTNREELLEKIYSASESKLKAYKLTLESLDNVI